MRPPASLHVSLGGASSPRALRSVFAELRRTSPGKSGARPPAPWSSPRRHCRFPGGSAPPGFEAAPPSSERPPPPLARWVRSPDWPDAEGGLWQRLLGRPASESGTLRHGGWDPWTERPLPEVVRVAYPPDSVHNHLFLSRHQQAAQPTLNRELPLRLEA